MARPVGRPIASELYTFDYGTLQTLGRQHVDKPLELDRGRRADAGHPVGLLDHVQVLDERTTGRYEVSTHYGDAVIPDGGQASA